ncbi:MAG TPA: lysozyme inhibitor LprI family protein [Trinickia sp.]
MKKMGLYAAAAATTLLASVSTSTLALAADLDCGKPRLPTERAVCANAALRSLDARANAYYSMLLEAKPVAESLPYRQFRDDLQTDEEKWRHDTRDACGTQVACLSDAYEHRIDALQASAAQHLGLVSAEAAAPHDAAPAQPSIDYKDAIYRIGQNDVTLLGGQHTQPAASDSSAQEVTRIVEPPEHGAGTLGGRPAVAVFLSQDGGGSGTFYYAAVVFGDGRGTTFQIGDRIRPIKIAINGDDLAVTYLDRQPDEPMAVPPTVPRERHFAYMNDQLVERPQAATAAK